MVVVDRSETDFDAEHMFGDSRSPADLCVRTEQLAASRMWQGPADGWRRRAGILPGAVEPASSLIPQSRSLATTGHERRRTGLLAAGAGRRAGFPGSPRKPAQTGHAWQR